MTLKLLLWAISLRLWDRFIVIQVDILVFESACQVVVHSQHFASGTLTREHSLKNWGNSKALGIKNKLTWRCCSVAD